LALCRWTLRDTFQLYTFPAVAPSIHLSNNDNQDPRYFRLNLSICRAGWDRDMRVYMSGIIDPCAMPATGIPFFTPPSTTRASTPLRAPSSSVAVDEARRHLSLVSPPPSSHSGARIRFPHPSHSFKCPPRGGFGRSAPLRYSYCEEPRLGRYRSPRHETGTSRPLSEPSR
jgi:hypothetical protein